MANLSLIKTLAKERKITLKSLSQTIGMTEQGMQSLIKNNATNTDTLERISQVLGVSPAVFFDVPQQGAANAVGDGASAIVGNDNEIVPKRVLDMLDQKDARINELTNKLLSLTK